MTNSGSAIAASTVVNTSEYIHVIKEGQVKNYIWDVANSQWVRDPGTVVNISGLQITVDVSGDPVTVSGNWVNVSGATILASVSGNWLNISGNYLASGQVVTVSGNWLNISGNYLASGQVVSISGDWVNVSGATILTSVSGNWLNISGNYLASGQVITVSGNWVNVSGATVLASVSGNWVNVSGATVLTSISGNWVNISGESIYPIYSPSSVNAVGSGAVALTFTNDATPRLLNYAEYTASSGTTTSSVLSVLHVSSDSGYIITMYSVQMNSNTVANVFYQPDQPMILDSGDIIKISFSNPDACAYYTRIMTRR